MNKRLDDDTSTDQQLKAFFNTKADGQSEHTDHVRHAISRTRFNVAKKDAVSFSFVKIWVAIAEMLAPLFAHFAAKRHASNRHKRQFDE